MVTKSSLLHGIILLANKLGASNGRQSISEGWPLCVPICRYLRNGSGIGSPCLDRERIALD
jgi:hypothetical protein